IVVEGLRREVDVVVNRVSKVVGIKSGDVVKLITLSAYLHDIGKALSAYQYEFNKCGKDEGEISLRGHEVYSTWVAYWVFDYLKVSNYEPFLAGIILHHSARRSLYNALLGFRGVNVSMRDVDTIVGVLRHIDELGLVSDIENFLTYASAGLEHNLKTSLKLAVDGILNAIINNQYSKYGELVTYLISIADNIDSNMRRSGKFTPITIRRFLRENSHQQ
ncbi:MAG: HD domain-containing protein, partial [Vulcanisaeta sp.]